MATPPTTAAGTGLSLQQLHQQQLHTLAASSNGALAATNSTLPQERRAELPLNPSTPGLSINVALGSHGAFPPHVSGSAGKLLTSTLLSNQLAQQTPFKSSVGHGTLLSNPASTASTPTPTPTSHSTPTLRGLGANTLKPGATPDTSYRAMPLNPVSMIMASMNTPTASSTVRGSVSRTPTPTLSSISSTSTVPPFSETRSTGSEPQSSALQTPPPHPRNLFSTHSAISSSGSSLISQNEQKTLVTRQLPNTALTSFATPAAPVRSLSSGSNTSSSVPRVNRQSQFKIPTPPSAGIAPGSTISVHPSPFAPQVNVLSSNPVSMPRSALAPNSALMAQASLARHPMNALDALNNTPGLLPPAFSQRGSKFVAQARSEFASSVVKAPGHPTAHAQVGLVRRGGSVQYTPAQEKRPRLESKPAPPNAIIMNPTIMNSASEVLKPQGMTDENAGVWSATTKQLRAASTSPLSKLNHTMYSSNRRTHEQVSKALTLVDAKGFGSTNSRTQPVHAGKTQTMSSTSDLAIGRTNGTQAPFLMRRNTDLVTAKSSTSYKTIETRHPLRARSPSRASSTKASSSDTEDEEESTSNLFCSIHESHRLALDTLLALHRARSADLDPKAVNDLQEASKQDAWNGSILAETLVEPPGDNPRNNEWLFNPARLVVPDHVAHRHRALAFLSTYSKGSVSPGDTCARINGIDVFTGPGRGVSFSFLPTQVSNSPPLHDEVRSTTAQEAERIQELESSQDASGILIDRVGSEVIRAAQRQEAFETSLAINRRLLAMSLMLDHDAIPRNTDELSAVYETQLADLGEEIRKFRIQLLNLHIILTNISRLRTRQGSSQKMAKPKQRVSNLSLALKALWDLEFKEPHGSVRSHANLNELIEILRSIDISETDRGLDCVEDVLLVDTDTELTPGARKVEKMLIESIRASKPNFESWTDRNGILARLRRLLHFATPLSLQLPSNVGTDVSQLPPYRPPTTQLRIRAPPQPVASAQPQASLNHQRSTASPPTSSTSSTVESREESREAESGSMSTMDNCNDHHQTISVDESSSVDDLRDEVSSPISKEHQLSQTNAVSNSSLAYPPSLSAPTGHVEDSTTNTPSDQSKAEYEEDPGTPEAVPSPSRGCSATTTGSVDNVLLSVV